MHKRSSFIRLRVLHSLPAAERLLYLQEGWGALWDPSGSPDCFRGCSWRRGEFCNILPDWKSVTLSDPCRISVAGFLGRWFCNVFVLDCCLNSLQQLVSSQLFCLAVFVIPLSGRLSWLCQSTSLAWGSCWGLPYMSSLMSVIFLRNSGTSSSLLSRFVIYRCSSFSYMIITFSFYHFGILEQCFLKTWSITILRAGKQ